MRKLQILGSGCAKCEQLAANAVQAAEALGLEYTMEKITDVGEMAAMGVALTPGLAVDGKVIVSGKVPAAEEIKGMLE